jgi:nucleoside-diphosphate-sugar epimerase
MRVFLTGGTGAIGRYAVKALVAAGHDVSALARTAEKAAELKAAGARPVAVSIFDLDGLIQQLKGSDAVVNLATALPATKDFPRMSAWADNNKVRAQGSATLVDAALKTGVPRFIQESVSMIYRDKGSEWIDEDWATDDFPMAASNHAAESSARRFTASGGTGVILRLGWFYGQGARHSEEFFDLARRWGIAIMMGAPNTYVSSIHVADAGNATVAALAARSGEYNVVDDEPLTKRAFADALANAAGRSWYIRAPGRLAHLAGNSTTSLTRSLRVSNARFVKETGWRPAYPTPREGFLSLQPSAN